VRDKEWRVLTEQPLFPSSCLLLLRMLASIDDTAVAAGAEVTHTSC
jgi:hypothetical protein